MEEQTTPPEYKLYTKNAILLATFLGGPPAAGFLMKTNFEKLGNKKFGNKVFWLCIIPLVLLLMILLFLPDNISDKVPRYIIPIISAFIIREVVKSYLDKQLEEHQQKNGQFYSGWSAAGIGALSMIIILAFAIAIAFTVEYVKNPISNENAEIYDKHMDEFQQLEAKAISILDSIEVKPYEITIQQIEEIGTPTWKAAKGVITKMDAIPDITDELKIQDQSLKSYCDLRIEQYELIGKALKENTNQYDRQLENLNATINKLLDNLNK